MSQFKFKDDERLQVRMSPQTAKKSSDPDEGILWVCDCEEEL
jgi:hypothetical protein